MTLLLDALDRTLKEPQCAQRWHKLLSICLKAGDAAARKSVLDALVASTCGESRADILRLTFLAGATGETRFEDAAAALVLEIEPGDSDRLAAFMACRWLTALPNMESRTDFTKALSAGRLPEMAKRLMQDATQAIAPGFLPRLPQAVQRVAVVVPYIGNRFHTPSIMAADQCSVLSRQGVQIHVFSAQELTPPDASLYRGDNRELILPPLDVQVWESMLPAGVAMTISDSRYSLPGRWRNLMPVLAKFDPDVVLLVGLYSPVAAALHAFRPLVGISVNTVAPIAPLDVWLTPGTELERQETWGGLFASPQPVFHPYRVRRPTSQGQLTRAELGLSETAVIWITAGFRLDDEIKGEWARRISQLMSGYPDVIWLLIGGEGKLPRDLRGAIADRVRVLPTRDDLPGILRNCDIYVNPPRMGGGISVAEAMAEGLPVTSFADSDGGDKVGELALAHMDDYMERLAALTENPSLRVDMGQSLRRRFAERLDLEASGPALVAACQQAAVLASGRLTRPS